ncbi:MAG TPA: glycoside hydrolase domain-containing protein [Bryobacteraceae bacterium]|nr:glycoside hydrolase domain-containing protein [Bryobacteraceae bacterium]
MSLPPTSAPTGSFPGFDTSMYPGDSTMSKWKAVSPYLFVAYYIKAPCHHDPGWMGKRATLDDMGWNLLPVYVGQQVVGASKCANNVLTAGQGQIDAEDASSKLAADGFAAGAYVYLDVERCELFPAALGEYVSSWVAKVVSAGLSPGVYCHRHNAADVRTATLAGLASPSAASPRFWIVGGVTADFHVNTSKPADSGIEFADLWQCPASVSRTFGGAAILIDEDVSSFADPSAVIPT